MMKILIQVIIYLRGKQITSTTTFIIHQFAFSVYLYSCYVYLLLIRVRLAGVHLYSTIMWLLSGIPMLQIRHEQYSKPSIVFASTIFGAQTSQVPPVINHIGRW